MSSNDVIKIIVLITILIISTVKSAKRKQKKVTDSDIREVVVTDVTYAKPEPSGLLTDEYSYKKEGENATFAKINMNSSDSEGDDLFDSDSQDLDENGAVIEFDIKKAIIYSEILNPKFKE